MIHHEKYGKRIAALFLTVLLAASLLSGCGKPIPEAEASIQKEEKEASKAEEPFEIPEETEMSEETEPEKKTEISERPIENLPEPVEEPPEPADEDLVRILDYVPDLYVELKYAGTDNFTGKVIYDFSEAMLRYGTVKKLMSVQTELKEQGYSLKIWDAYRPVSAQFVLWEVCPDPVYVADPKTGYSGHSKGNTVEVTLVYADGSETEMPTGFDDFTSLADRDYGDVNGEAAKNAQLLEDTMSAHGFDCYFGEWWHFSDTTPYPVMEE